MLTFFATYGTEVLLAVVILIATSACKYFYGKAKEIQKLYDGEEAKAIDKAIDNVSLRVTKIGAYMNRLDSAIDSTDVQKENLTETPIQAFDRGQKMAFELTRRNYRERF